MDGWDGTDINRADVYGWRHGGIDVAFLVRMGVVNLDEEDSTAGGVSWNVSGRTSYSCTSVVLHRGL